MMAHTPGPWVFREPEGDELHEIYAEGSGDLICYPVWTDNQQANIPLIAASPELLAAARLANQELIDMGQGSSASPALRSLWMAIAKAEGRSNE